MTRYCAYVHGIPWFLIWARDDEAAQVTVEIAGMAAFGTDIAVWRQTMTLYVTTDKDGRELEVFESLEKAERAQDPDGQIVHRMGNLTRTYGLPDPEPHE